MKSIKAKIIVSVITLLIIILTVVNLFVNLQMQKQTENVLINQSEVAVKEMSRSIENNMLQYEKTLYMLTENPNVTSFIERRSMVPKMMAGFKSRHRKGV